jgi:hypothetical protein
VPPPKKILVSAVAAVRQRHGSPLERRNVLAFNAASTNAIEIAVAADMPGRTDVE